MTQREKDYRAAHKVRWGTGWKVISNDSESVTVDYFRACQIVRDRREEAREAEEQGLPILKAPWPEC